MLSAPGLDQRPQWWVDALLALSIVGYGLAESVLAQEHLTADAAAVAITLSALPVLLSSRWPVAAALISAVGLATTSALADVDESFVPLIGPALTAFAAGRRGSARALVVIGLTDVVAVMLAASVPAGPADRGAAGFMAAATVLAVAVGRASREMQLETDALRDEAAELERRRAVDVARAAEAERLRIARELHDVLGHSISVMSIQAAAVRRRLLPSQEDERAALVAVEEAARESVVELRRLLGLLRDADDQHGELGSAARLLALVDEARRAGVPVEVDGAPLVDELPSGLALTVMRIVQEGLTNVRRHAPTARAAVTIRRTGKGLVVSVVDDGAGQVPVTGGGGFGLVGMRERVAVFGGSLTTGAQPGGGFALVAELPT